MAEKKKNKNVADPIKVTKVPGDVYAQLEREANEATIGVSTRIRQILIEHYRKEAIQEINPSAAPMGAN